MENKKLSVEESTWEIGFQLWQEELKNRRKEYVENYDNKELQNSYDSFYDLGDNCWGDINGRLVLQYFELLKELSDKNSELFEKYNEDATAILKMFSFFSVPKSYYVNFYQKRPNPYSRNK